MSYALLRRTAAILLTLSAVVRPANAFFKGVDLSSITGRVTGLDGKPISQAVVQLVEARRSTRTDDDGRYVVAQVPRGTYTLVISTIGYRPEVRSVTVADADVTLDTSLKPSIIELDAVQVSASAEATSAMNSPQPVAVASQEDLLKSRPNTLGDALAGLAGVHNNSSGASTGKPVIRGLTNTRVLVVDDGQRLEHNQWGDDHFSSVEPANASRIEVIRGPASVLYGTDALGGVVNIIEPDLPDAIGRAPFAHGSVTGAFGSNNNQPDGSASLEGASGSWGFRASGTGRTAKDVHTPTYILWNSGYHNVGGNGSLAYHTPWGSLTGRYTMRRDRLQLTDSDSTFTGYARTDDDRVHLDLSAGLGASRLEWTAGYQTNRRSEYGDAKTTVAAFGMRQKAYTTEAHLHHALGSLKGVLGASGEYATNDNFGEEHLMPNSTTGGAALYAFEQKDAGRWNFSFGARYDYRHLSADADTALGNGTANLKWNSVTGNTGLLYHVSEPVALVLNLGRGFRAPSGFDLFANGPHEATATFEVGNPNLKTETSLNTDLSLRIQSGSVAAEFGGFVNTIQNFIYSVPTGTTDSVSGLPIFNVTQGNAKLSGVEGQVEFHPTGYLHLQGTADYVRGQNTSTHEALPSMPPFRATYLARLEGRRFGALVEPYFSIGGETNAKQTRLNPAELTFFADAFSGAGYRPAQYTLVNLAAGFSLPSAAGRTLAFDFQLRNAFNKQWADYLSHLKTNAPNPGMGRNVVARVTASF
jgi:iron complex outermembrane receptor protein